MYMHGMVSPYIMMTIVMAMIVEYRSSSKMTGPVYLAS